MERSLDAQRLHCEGQAVDDGADDQSIEGESEWVANPASEDEPGCTQRTEKPQQVKAEHGRWQYKRERGQQFHRGAPTAATVREPPGQRHRHDKQDERGDDGQA